jgi:hypothetical protein
MRTVGREVGGREKGENRGENPDGEPGVETHDASRKDREIVLAGQVGPCGPI